MKNLIRFHQVRVDYGSVSALQDVNLDIRAGEIFGVVGPNGSGKSSLLNLLSGLKTPSSGEISIADGHKSIKIGIAFQTPCLDDKLTVLENLVLSATLNGVGSKARHERISLMLERLALKPLSERIVETLSGGQKRRVDLARAFVHAPELLIFDEPTSGIDKESTEHIWNFVRQKVREEGLTVVVATHLDEESLGCDRIAVLDRGRIQVVATPNELLEKYEENTVEVELNTDCAEVQLDLQGLGEVIERSPTRLRFATRAGERLIPRVCQELGTQNIVSVSMRTTKISDVFFRLTGKTWEQSQDLGVE